jgi:PAS domain-containing protein
MILRIAQGRLLAGRDAHALADLRDQIRTAARTVRGLESLIIGARRSESDPEPTPDGPPIEAAIVTVWHDAAAMLAATAIDEAGRFLGGRLALPFAVDAADHYEILDRWFAALPPETVAVVRILRVRARQRDEARLLATLRAQQPRFADLGIIASHLGRRIADGDIEAVLVGVWPDRATVRRATLGQPEAPLFAAELAEWRDRTHVEMFDGIEIAPKLPAASGPPLIILDEQLRIVDLTTSAAAMLGLPAEDLVGRRAGDLFRDPSGPDRASDGTDGSHPIDQSEPALEAWPRLLAEGVLEGDASWAVPEIGSVLVRFHARRDVPIAGRHTVVIRRRQDPPPTADDLAAALAEAFPVA